MSYDPGLEPRCLLSLSTGLTSFSLQDMTLQPRGAQQDGTWGASQLLQLLAQLTNLRMLALSNLSGLAQPFWHVFLISCRHRNCRHTLP